MRAVSTWIFVPGAAVAWKTARLYTNPFPLIKHNSSYKDIANEQSKSASG